MVLVLVWYCYVSCWHGFGIMFAWCWYCFYYCVGMGLAWFSCSFSLVLVLRTVGMILVLSWHFFSIALVCFWYGVGKVLV